MATIYKIYSPKGDKVYIGSTIQPIDKRMHRHRAAFRKNDLSDSYCSRHIFQEYGIANTIIEELEKTDITNQYIREQYWLDQHPTKVNIKKAFYTEEEKEEAKQKEKERKSAWAKAKAESPESREAYLEKQRNNQKAYYTEHREKLIEKSKEYQKKNPEKISEKNKQNHQKLKEDPEKYAEKIAKLREKQDIKVTCVCGKEITQGSLLRHMKSKEHATKLNLTDASSA